MDKNLIKNIQSTFIKEFNSTPTLVFSPGRINIVGEHTDYNDGFVFPAAIDKGIVVAIDKSNTKHSSVIALNMNERVNFSLNEIKPIDKGNWKNYILGIIAEIKKTDKKIDNFNLVFGGNIPSGAGMSSSAALENSVIFGLNELFKLNFSKKEMILISQKAEHNFVGVKCGIMDQYASMFGQKKSAILLNCKNLDAAFVKIDLKNYTFLLINTNVKHSLAESTYNKRRAVCEKIAALLNKNSLTEVTENDLLVIKKKVSNSEFQKALYVIQENNRVISAYQAVKNNDTKLLGKILYASHNGLQNQYKVSCDELNFLVDLGKQDSNVIGARMMGGGFGGCTINIIKKDAIKSFKKEVLKTYYKKFNNNCSFYTVKLSDGTRVVKFN